MKTPQQKPVDFDDADVGDGADIVKRYVQFCFPFFTIHSFYRVAIVRKIKKIAQTLLTETMFQ